MTTTELEEDATLLSYIHNFVKDSRFVHLKDALTNHRNTGRRDSIDAKDPHLMIFAHGEREGASSAFNELERLSKLCVQKQIEKKKAPAKSTDQDPDLET